jgi:general stress protein YciG
MTMQELNERSEGPSTSQSTTQSTTPRRSPRGFAAMDPQRQREIASLGGRAAHQSGHAHEFTSEEARAAGRKRHAKANGSAGPSA